MKLDAMIDPRALGLTCFAFLYLKVMPGQIEAVASELASWSELSFVSVASGLCDVLGVATVPDRCALAEFVNTRASMLAGVTSVAVKEYTEVIKMTSNLVQILPVDRGAAEEE